MNVNVEFRMTKEVPINHDGNRNKSTAFDIPSSTFVSLVGLDLNRERIFTAERITEKNYAEKIAESLLVSPSAALYCIHLCIFVRGKKKCSYKKRFQMCSLTNFGDRHSAFALN